VVEAMPGILTLIATIIRKLRRFEGLELIESRPKN